MTLWKKDTGGEDEQVKAGYIGTGMFFKVNNKILDVIDVVIVKGDVTGKGEVNGEDCIAVLSYILKHEPTGGMEREVFEKAADIADNKTGKAIDIEDLMMIRRIASGKN